MAIELSYFILYSDAAGWLGTLLKKWIVTATLKISFSWHC